MDDCTWTFSRQDEKLHIRRTPVADGCVLEIITDGKVRSIHFAHLEALVIFQSDMEALLLKTGWSFQTFAPERRSGRDRRDWPRISERRRWWTDGPRPESDATPRAERRRKPRK